MYFNVHIKWALDIHYFCSIIAVHFFWILSFFWRDFPVFLCICRRWFVCILSFTLVSGLFILGVWVSGGFSGGPGHIFFCVELRCVGCRAGTIYLSACLEWVAGLYRFFFFGLCCGEYGTIYLSSGRGWAAGLYRFSSGVICWSCGSKLLILFWFITGGGGRVRTRRAMSPCWSRRSWSIAGWIWRPVLRSTSLMCGLWRTITWCWRMERRRMRSSLRFATWIVRSSSWSLSWLLWSVCCLLMIRRLFNLEWCVSELGQDMLITFCFSGLFLFRFFA